MVVKELQHSDGAGLIVLRLEALTTTSGTAMIACSDDSYHLGTSTSPVHLYSLSRDPLTKAELMLSTGGGSQETLKIRALSGPRSWEAFVASSLL